MAKPKKQPSVTPKKRSTKYSKLAAVCSKELTAKKKALVLAEKRLAKATRTHQELLAEVARLDMLDRSLRAVNEGLEPPQNVKYVYTYPQWVWNPYPNQWWYNGGYSPTITLGGTFQGGQYSNTFNTVQTTTTGVNCGTAGNVSYVANSGNLNLASFNNGSGLISNDSGVQSVLTSSSPNVGWSTGNTGTADLTVDLSTGATDDETTMEEVLAAAKEVGHGG